MAKTLDHKNNYYNKIDGLRFVAITLVLIEHFASIFARYIAVGYYGVDLFFVISGFLITSILLKPNKHSFKKNYLNFLGRRTLRIFPIYYMTLLILFLLNVEDIRHYIIYLLTYTSNYGMIAVGLPEAPIRHLWSLSVEEQFYLFWPFVVLCFKQKILWLAVLMIVIIVAGYTQMVFNIFPAVTKYNYWGIFPRMSSLALGGLGALLSTSGLVPGKLLNNKIFEIFTCLMLAFLLISSSPFKVILLGLCSLYFILKAAHYGFQIKLINTFLDNRRVMYIGTISYGIYLFHLPIGYFFTKYIFDPIWYRINFKELGRFEILQWHSWIIKFPLYSLLSILIAALSFKFIEQPILRFKYRLFPR